MNIFLREDVNIVSTDNYRSLFSGIERKVLLANGEQIIPINFDNAATTPPLKKVDEFICENITMYGSVGRGGQKSEYCTNAYEISREMILKFFSLEEKDGYNHLHVYSLNNGRYIYQVGKGNYDVTKIYGYNAKSKQIFYQSNGNGPLNRGIYAINVKTGKRTSIAVEEGTNDAFFSKDFKYFELIYSSVNQPHIYSVCESDGDVLRELHKDVMSETIKKEFFQFTDSLSGWIIRKPGVTNAPVIFDLTVD